MVCNQTLASHILLMALEELLPTSKIQKLKKMRRLFFHLKAKLKKEIMEVLFDSLMADQRSHGALLAMS